MLAGVGRARLRAASRKPSPRRGCGRECDGPRRWAYALRGLRPRASQLGAQLAATSAPRRHLLSVLPGAAARSCSRRLAQAAGIVLRVRAKAAAAGCCGAPDPRPRDAPPPPPAGPASGSRWVIPASCAPQPHSPRFFPAELRKGRSPAAKSSLSPARSPDGAAAGAVKAPTEP